MTTHNRPVAPLYGPFAPVTTNLTVWGTVNNYYTVLPAPVSSSVTVTPVTGRKRNYLQKKILKRLKRLGERIEQVLTRGRDSTNEYDGRVLGDEVLRAMDYLSSVRDDNGVHAYTVDVVDVHRVLPQQQDATDSVHSEEEYCDCSTATRPTEFGEKKRAGVSTTSSVAAAPVSDAPTVPGIAPVAPVSGATSASSASVPFTEAPWTPMPPVASAASAASQSCAHSAPVASEPSAATPGPAPSGKSWGAMVEDGDLLVDEKKGAAQVDETVDTLQYKVGEKCRAFFTWGGKQPTSEWKDAVVTARYKCSDVGNWGGRSDVYLLTVASLDEPRIYRDAYENGPEIMRATVSHPVT